MAEPPFVLQPSGPVHFLARGRKLLHFGGCDYFRLSTHPKVLAAAQSAMLEGGLNVAASRMTTGNRPIYQVLERALARFFRTESAVLTSSGYATAWVTASALVGSVSHVFVDEKAHACLREAVQLLQALIRTYPHRNPAELQRRLRRLPSSANPLIVTDGMFSSDGVLAPLPELMDLVPKSGLFWVDDSHGAGTLGKHGRGTLEELSVQLAGRKDQLILTTTLSKAFGCYGGSVLGPNWLREKILERSGMFTGNTPLPPLFASAALAAIEVLKSDPTLRQRLRKNTGQLKILLRNTGWNLEDSVSPVMALVPGSAHETKRLQSRLLKAGILPTFIRYPGGPEGQFLRIAVSSEHTPEQIEQLAAALDRS